MKHRKHEPKQNSALANDSPPVVQEWHSLNVNMEPQCQTNWCWSATSVSIALFYSPTPAWTQCAVVNMRIGRTDCCTKKCNQLDENASCNQAGYPDDALTAVGHFGQTKSGGLTFDALKTEIDGRRPISVNIQWKKGGGHNIAIDGYQPSAVGAPDMISIQDPLHGPTTMAFANFPDRYLTGAYWYETYLTVAQMPPRTGAVQ